ncbi:hypothetical protein [Streptomyces sp. NBC_01546]|uniref:hypothetical protein n=1 Tax=Streptomyces sp. NBC_01546 TaxID=2975872 RepID=UPI00386F3F91
MRTSTRIASVLTGLTLALGGAAFTAPAAHADVTACINQVNGSVEPNGDNAQCVSGLTAGGVTNGTAVSACKVAPN